MLKLYRKMVSLVSIWCVVQKLCQFTAKIQCLQRWPPNEPLYQYFKLGTTKSVYLTPWGLQKSKCVRGPTRLNLYYIVRRWCIAFFFLPTREQNKEFLQNYPTRQKRPGSLLNKLVGKKHSIQFSSLVKTNKQTNKQSLSSTIEKSAAHFSSLVRK